MHLLQTSLTTATVWWMDYPRISQQVTPACAKHSCQTSFQSGEIWSHNSCTRYASLASSQIPDWIQNTVDCLQRTSWQGTNLHPRNDHPIKKQNIFLKIQWRTCPEGSKIQAWYFRQACIRSIWASGMELLAKGNKVMWWNWRIQGKPKDSSFCQICEWVYSCKLILKNHCKAS